MILSDIKRYLKNHGQATLEDLAVHFDTAPAAMRGMMDRWIEKGRAQREALHAGCSGSCSRCCETAAMEIYRWQDS